jgi:cell division septation protein DedD
LSAGGAIHMLSILMPNILVFIDDAMARALEKVAPARSRERSRFIRLAIQKALMELQDTEAEKAYERAPSDAPDSIARGAWDRYMPADLRSRARAARSAPVARPAPTAAPKPAAAPTAAPKPAARTTERTTGRGRAKGPAKARAKR